MNTGENRGQVNSGAIRGVGGIRELSTCTDDFFVAVDNDCRRQQIVQVYGITDYGDDEKP